MVKRIVFILLTTLTLLAAGMSVSLAAPFYEGRPSQFDPGDSSGYFIWHDQRGWHLISTAEGRERRFSGTIRTDGDIHQVRSIRLERGDRMRPNYQRDIISFDFRSGEREDGIVFEVSGERYVQFELFIDGRRVNPQYVFVGRHNWRPSQSPFRIELY